MALQDKETITIWEYQVEPRGNEMEHQILDINRDSTHHGWTNKHNMKQSKLVTHSSMFQYAHRAEVVFSKQKRNRQDSKVVAKSTS